MCWIASLGGKVQPKTIKNYLSHVRSLHVDADLPFSVTESPIVQRLIRGIKRFHGEKDRKPVQPITRSILLAILAQLCPGVVPGHTTLYAMYCLAYAGLLRSGEITAGSGKSDASLNLTRDAVQFFPDFETCTHMVLTLPGSKTDPFRKGVSLSIAAAPGHASCPVTAIKKLFVEFPRPGSAPLFEGLDGKPLHYKVFVAGIRTALTAAGINPWGFAESSIYHTNSTWLILNQFLSNLRLFATTPPWLESDPRDQLENFWTQYSFDPKSLDPLLLSLSLLASRDEANGRVITYIYPASGSVDSSASHTALAEQSHAGTAQLRVPRTTTCAHTIHKLKKEQGKEKSKESREAWDMPLQYRYLSALKRIPTCPAEVWRYMDDSTGNDLPQKA
ncbi:hypothetical protein GGX14DRAFT_401288 [Mycena pura]|uniref:Uncharacterized protein n=1 Tax=Mycena pura TaxID=153505 RepID=A0AAD6V4K6_9AGAR|nr:hypothetical protein GGX14DRAFT_401288 [Mycena pura]